ncbi:MAG: xanthan lyase [Candidatus Marinimicrobia bacterium]|nr:xanthan lyase [Candidatus Neomarinimicrobiota bacterium]
MDFRKLYLLLLMIVFTGCSVIRISPVSDETFSAEEMKLMARVTESVVTMEKDPVFKAVANVAKPDTVVIDKSQKSIKLYFNKYLSYIPFRVENVDFFYTHVRQHLGRKYRHYFLEIYTLGTPIEQLVPNYFREDKSAYDKSRLPVEKTDIVPLITRQDWIPNPEKGLKSRNIALWHSHGWYYSNTLNRWEWQRPRLFQTVEDLFPFSFTIPYLVPMLENAGATVFLPRERDLQTHEVVIDNDSPMNAGRYLETGDWEMADNTGFALGLAPYTTGENPFRAGTARKIECDSIASATIQWVPDIPEAGRYGVYISYLQSELNVSDAEYTVFHQGGCTTFRINQQMGGNTWIYLGQFQFAAGMESGKVELSNQSEDHGRFVTADAVRFGGGMGDVQRGASISHRPRFVEGARYYLQYAGMPDTVIYHVNQDKNDYNDDYTSRGEWVNYLTGAPNGPNKCRNMEGLNIPVDLSFSFHTDAGITKNENVIGTLSIYSLPDAEDQFHFPAGYSRLANRDLADLVQTQIVEDTRIKYDPQWNRRGLMNGKYSEAFRPNVPSMLLELLSHQNLQDMKYGLDPRFKFDISRAIYKGMLKYIATSNGYDFIVQPLPVDHFQVEFFGPASVALRWQSRADVLEPTARADQYIVYTRRDTFDFDNGVVVSTPEFLFEGMEPGLQYSFKVTAINRGGESFPSEILSACWVENAQDTVLIVNNFDRISAAAIVEEGKFRGFASFLDEGVPDRFDIGFTGLQHDFNSESPWLTNDYPGWGASGADYEVKIIAGNSFDYPFIHGKSVRNRGYSYVSASDESVESGQISLSDYRFIDMIFGEEKSTHFSPKNDSLIYRVFSDSMISKITKYTETGGNIFMSGAYLASDMFRSPKDTSEATKFARNILRYNLGTDHAARSGQFYFNRLKREVLLYNHQFSGQIYKLEAPDALMPVNQSRTVMRFTDNEFGAGIAYNGETYNLVISTIPLETVLTQRMRDDYMQKVLDLLNNKN